MSWVAVAIGGSALLGLGATNKAGKAQSSATKDAVALQIFQAKQARRDSAPWRRRGGQAVNRMGELLGLGEDPATPLTPEEQQRFSELSGQEEKLKSQLSKLEAFLSVAGRDHGTRHFNEFFGPKAAKIKQRLDELEKLKSRSIRSSQEPGTQQGGSFGSLNKKFTIEDFLEDPVTKLSFQHGLDEGTKALDRMAGATGSRQSGAQLKALTRFGQNYSGQRASDSYNRFYGDQDRDFNRLAVLSGMGQTATTNFNQQGSQAASNAGNLLTAQGNARGAAAISRANILGGAGQSFANWYNQNQMLDRFFPRGGQN